MSILSDARSLLLARCASLRENRPDTDISDRTSARQVEMLDASVWSAAANIVAAFVIAVIVRECIAPLFLFVWVAALILIFAALLLRVRHHARRAAAGGKPASSRSRLAEHALFAVLIGAVWSVFGLFAGPLLSSPHLLVLSLTVVGCASGAIPALGVYLPAFYGFCATALVPLAYVNYMRASSDAVSVALLILLFGTAVAFNARAYHRSVAAALRLRAKNERLADSVVAAEAATDAAMKSKWESFAHLSHELRTPMNAVLGFADMMRKQMFGALSERYLDYAGYIHDSGSQALSLIDAILEVSRAKAGQLSLDETEIEPAALVAECLHAVLPEAGEKRLRLHFDNPPGLPLLHADRRKIARMLLNLLGNAVNYTEQGGEVTLSLRADEVGLAFVVADTGIGIAPGDILRCQEPFIRLGDPLVSGVEGAGLGLSIARLLAEAHGGQLVVESRLGYGTTVTVRLPAARCCPAAPAVPVVAGAGPHLRLVAGR